MSNQIIDQVERLVRGAGVSGRHTFYQLKHFVLGKEVTTQAKMWKCIRELEARLGSVRSMKNAIEEGEDDIRAVEIRLAVLEKKKTKSVLHREYRQIRRRKLERRLSAIRESVDETRRRLSETEEEMGFFLGAYRQMEAMEPLRPHDDPEANANYWDQNFAQELQLRLMFGKPLDLELVKCILALDDGSSTRRELVGMIEQIQRCALGLGDATSKSLEQKEKSIEENL